MSHQHAHLLAATLDEPAPEIGVPLPILWHWAFFSDATPTSGLGPDGHPRRNSSAMSEFPRRMWVGGAVRSDNPLYTGRPASRHTRLLDSTLKHGSSGDLVVVVLEHRIVQDSVLTVVERQEVIYRTAHGLTAAPGERVHIDGQHGWREEVEPTSAMLFRFSAVTFNSHRIHYDRDYAINVEHYPDLVVHGPLTAMLLAASAARQARRTLTSFSFRASAPLFVDQPIRISGSTASTEPETLAVAATRFDGVTAMKSTAM